MPISLILTPFDYFQIHPSFAVTPSLILEPCPIELFWTAKNSKIIIIVILIVIIIIVHLKYFLYFFFFWIWRHLWNGTSFWGHFWSVAWSFNINHVVTSFRISFWCLFWGTIFGFIRQADEPHFWSKLSQKVAVAQAAHFLEHLVEDTWNGWKEIPLLIISEGYALLYHLLDVRVPNSAHRHAWTETGPEIYGQNVSSRREHRTHFCISLLSSYQFNLRPCDVFDVDLPRNRKNR